MSVKITEQSENSSEICYVKKIENVFSISKNFENFKNVDFKPSYNG